MTAYLSGFALGLSLILAIGAQNAFVLKQGLKKQHVFLVCSLCAISDAILIVFGVTGFGALVEQYPWVEQVARYGGAAFLTVYAMMSFYSAYSQKHNLVPSDNAPESVWKITLMCLGFHLVKSACLSRHRGVFRLYFNTVFSGHKSLYSRCCHRLFCFLL